MLYVNVNAGIAVNTIDYPIVDSTKRHAIGGRGPTIDGIIKVSKI